MHDAHHFLSNLTLVLGVAALTTIVFQRLRQPVVFGYLMAGLIVGPHVPVPLVADQEVIRTLSELGVILVMFSLGLEFSLRRLARAGWPVVMIAVLETSFMIWLAMAGRLVIERAGQRVRGRGIAIRAPRSSSRFRGGGESRFHRSWCSASWSSRT
jgi:Kef-type K+ transport system membrane component KefB